MSAAEHFVYIVVFPLCVIFAYKRIPFRDLRANTAVWAIPFAIAEFAVASAHRDPVGASVATAAALCVYVTGVMLGHRLERWVLRRRGEE